MNKTSPILLEETAKGILRLTLNRPAVGNCLNFAFLKALRDRITIAGTNTDIRVIIIAANGSLFCSGHDLKEMTARRSDEDAGREFFQTTLNACSAMMQAIIECPKPVIAEVQGPALAAGAQLIATCDLAVASTNAGFCLPGVNIGLFCSTPMVALTRAVGRKKSMEMLVTGDAISAEEAERYGLIKIGRAHV